MIGRAVVLVCSLVLPACLSSAPPAPPVRWFDPLDSSPTDTGEAALAAPGDIVVGAAFDVRQEFALRVGPHEFAYDDDHRWAADPCELVRRALLRRSGRQPAAGVAAEGSEVMEVVVEAFEIDLRGAPAARVQLRVVRPEHAFVGTTAPAASRAPADLAAAMAVALADAADQVFAPPRAP
jgi:hypothetical protein